MNWFFGTVKHLFLIAITFGLGTQLFLEWCVQRLVTVREILDDRPAVGLLSIPSSVGRWVEVSCQLSDSDAFVASYDKTLGPWTLGTYEGAAAPASGTGKAPDAQRHRIFAFFPGESPEKIPKGEQKLSGRVGPLPSAFHAKADELRIPKSAYVLVVGETRWEPPFSYIPMGLYGLGGLYLLSVMLQVRKARRTQQ